ncbi:Uncharacterized protein SCG7086_BO_00080 [Chlamydiales bacterium SCGC AG-110-P3]|nr:Uncharacterized protein SCG7086_BO_00080 [Chlamydiales bacterium SCGC AG-110-P3]
MNWLEDPSMDVEPWQVENYRDLSDRDIFDRLERFEIRVDKSTFFAYAEESSDPEELADALVGDEDDAKLQDQIFLLVFELWRRYEHDKLDMSIFCDELDWQINLYDRDAVEDSEAVQDVLSILETVLDENVDQGGEPIDVFQAVAAECANDLPDFLYDFISDQIDSDNMDYALELADGFIEYLEDDRWFQLLKARIAERSDLEEVNGLLDRVVNDVFEEEDLELVFEILEVLVEGGQVDLFGRMVETATRLLKKEEEFQELLTVCASFFGLSDYDAEEAKIQLILAGREYRDPEGQIVVSEADVQQLGILVREFCSDQATQGSS